MKHTKAKKHTAGFGLTGILVKLVVIALVIYAAVTLYHLHGQIQVATAQQVDLAAQVQVLQDRNQALRADIAASDKQEKLEEVARDELGMVKNGEKVFYDTSY